MFSQHHLHETTRGAIKERCYEEHYDAVAPATGYGCLLKNTQSPAAGRLWTDWQRMGSCELCFNNFPTNPQSTWCWLYQRAETKGRLQTEKRISSHLNLARVRNDDILTLTFFQPKINQGPRKTSHWFIQYVDLCTSDKMVRTITLATRDNLQLVWKAI